MATNNVVLVSSHDQTINALRSISSEVPDIHVTEVVRSSFELAAALSAGTVHAVLVDSKMTELPFLDFVRSVTTNYPRIAVLVITPEADREFLAAAMEVGARGIVEEPLGLQDVQAAIERAGHWTRSITQLADGVHGLGGGPRRGRVVAIAGVKGGVGTTLLSCLLAVEASQGGNSVCVVDMDIRAGDVAAYSGVKPKRSIADLADVGAEITGRAVTEVAVTGTVGYAVIAAPTEIERCEDIDGYSIRHVLNELRQQFDLVIVDAGRALDDLQATVLESADRAVLVLGPDIISVRAARRTLSQWQRLQVRSTKDLVVVLNQADRRREVQADLVRRILEVPSVLALPLSHPEVEAAVNTGQLEQVRPGPLVAQVKDLADACQIERRAVAGPTGRKGRGSRKKGGATAAGERGQAAVELPLAFLVFVTCLFFCIQGLMIGTSNLFAQHAANAAARQLSVHAPAEKVRAAAQQAVPGGLGSGFQMQVDSGARQVDVTVDIPTLFPMTSIVPQQATASAGYLEEPQ